MLRDSSMNKRLQRVADAGVPLGESLRATPLWRATPAGKIHTIGSCPRLRRATPPPPVGVDVIAATKDQWCSLCATKGGSAKTALAEWLDLAETAVALRAAIATGGQVAVRNLLSQVRADRRYAPEDLHVSLDDVIDAAQSVLAEVSGAASRAAAVRAAAAQSFYEAPEGTRIEVCHPGNYGRNVTEKAWKVMQARLNGGDDIPTAAGKARADALNRLDEEFCHDRVPDTVVLDPSAFAHPHDWARAEWRVAAEAELEANLATWAAAVRTAAATPGEVTVLVSWGRIEEDRQALLLPFDPVFDPNEHYALVAVPTVIAEELPRKGRWGAFVSEVLDDRSHDPAVLEVAIAMIDPVDSAGAAEVLNAAALIAGA